MTRQSEWQRVSPVSIVYFALKSLPHLVNLWPILIPAFAGSEAVQRYVLVYGVPAVLVLMLLGVILQYWFFTFCVEPDGISLRSGVLSRKRLSLDFERVQQADIAHPFYFRPFSLATLGLESAGSAQQEVDIPGIPIQLAETLRQQVLDKQRETDQVSGADEPESAPEADYSLRLSAGEIARYGLMQNTLLYLAPLAAPFGQQLGPLLESTVSSVEHSQLYRAFEWFSSHLAVSIAIVMAVFAVVVGTTVLFGLSVLLALFRYWNYHLTRRGERFQYRAGLTTVRTRGFKWHKLQQITISQGVIARLLQRYTLQISKAGSFAAAPGAGQQQRFVVPVLDLLNLLLLREQLALPAPSWWSVKPLYYLWPFTLLSLLIVGATVGAWQLGAPHAWWAMLALPVLWLICRRRWRCLGYFIDGEWLALRTGFIGSTQQWVPSGKLQKLQISQSPLKRWFGLVDLHVWSAAGRLTIPCLPETAAAALRDRLLGDVVNYRGPWL